MNSLTNAKLADICSLVTDGTHDSPKLQESGIPFIKGKHINSGRIDFESCDYISPDDHEKCIKRVKPKLDDILIANIGASIGDCARVITDHEFSIKNVALLRPDPKQIDPTYFYHFVNSPVFQRPLLNLRLGAAQPYVSLAAFRGYEVPIISDQIVQRKIGEIAESYERLIENNRRRIALLEEAARLLYREWFVHFRFPGHEHVNIVDGLPKGWRFIKVQDAVKRHPPGKLYAQKNALNEGKVPILDQGQSGIIGFHNDEPSFLASTEDPVIVFANHTCYQRLIHYPFSAIQNVLPFKPGPEMPDEIYWLHHATEGLVKLNAYKGHWPEFSAKEFLVPSDDLAKDFSNIVRPQHLQIYKLNEQNIHLAKARDLLLPRLMDGRLEV